MEEVYVKVSFDLDVPDGMDDDEIAEFVSYHLNNTSELSGNNPMIDDELEPKPYTFNLDVSR